MARNISLIDTKDRVFFGLDGKLAKEGLSGEFSEFVLKPRRQQKDQQN